jgi:hypothetical protein
LGVKPAGTVDAATIATLEKAIDQAGGQANATAEHAAGPRRRLVLLMRCLRF